MKKILLSIFLCLPFLLSAQPYTIKHLSIREGLSNNHVVSIAQDKRGSLWFATEEGLNKFDGIRFLTYYKEETTGKQSITGNELNCLLDDPVDSILWIGTQRAGINAYNYANDSFITYRHNENNPESLVTDDITKIIAASDGNLWICTYWKGVDYFDKQTGQFTHYNTETVPGFASNHIWSAIDGGNGLLYIGHVDRGFSILSIKDKTVKNFTHEPQNPNSLPGNEVTCVYKDKSGNIWIGANEQLIFTTHNTDMLDLNLPKHSYMFLRKLPEDGRYKISAVSASDVLKRNTDSIRNAVENDVFASLPQDSLLDELEMGWMDEQ